MMNMMNMMKQAQNLQKKLVEAQNELANTNITAVAGNGAVKIITDGKGVFKSIELTAEAINPENPESVSQDDIDMLVDLITAAMNTAIEKSKTVMEEKMKSATGGISLPGLM